MKTYWYILDLNPVPWRVGPAGAARNATTGKMKGYVGRDQELYNYQQAVKEELARQNPVLVTGRVRVTMWFWRAIEEYKTVKSMTARSNHADGTNLYKGTEDACQKILFPNDRENVRGFWYIVEQDSDIQGRVIIKVEDLPDSYDQRGEALEALSEEVYQRVFGTAGEQLALSVNAPKATLEGDDEYGRAEQIF